MSSRNMWKEDVTQAAQEALGFLVSEQGFTGPLCDAQRLWTHLRYMRGSLGIELELDWFECWPFLLLVHLDRVLENGAWPTGYIPYSRGGKLCRVHLQRVMKHYSWSITVPLPGGEGNASPERMTADIRTDAQTLREAIGRILEVNVRIFDQIPGPPYF